MTRRSFRYYAECLAYAFALLTLIALPARAGQHCVTCQAPEATYLCEAQNVPGLLAANGGQLACITELAKRGGHASCSVIRREADRCDGLAPTVLFPGAASDDTGVFTDAVPPAPPTTTAQPDVQTESDAAASDQFTADDQADPVNPEDKKANAKPQGPPKTVVEMADRAYEGSKEGLGKAGKAVGDTAKSAGKVVTDTAQKTGEQIGKAGKAVGNAASKTWKCLTSLFSEC